MSSSAEIIKKRAPNYNIKEKEVLLNIIIKYKSIIENKKTDGASVSEKKEAWFKITKDFNALSPNNVFRDTSSLKKYYDNIKEDLRKRAGNEKQSIYKTGGGPPSPKLYNAGDELLLNLVNQKTIYGLNNSYDNDAQTQEDTIIEDNNINNIEIIYAGPLKDPQNDPDVSSFSNEETPSHSNNKDDVTDNSTWATYKATDLEKPMKAPLRRNLKRVCAKPNTHSRGSHVKVLSSSKLGEKYEALIDKKLKLASGLEEEHNLRMILLRFDIALKKKELRAAGYEDVDITLMEAPEFLL